MAENRVPVVVQSVEGCVTLVENGQPIQHAVTMITFAMQSKAVNEFYEHKGSKVHSVLDVMKMFEDLTDLLELAQTHRERPLKLACIGFLAQWWDASAI